MDEKVWPKLSQCLWISMNHRLRIEMVTVFTFFWCLFRKSMTPYATGYGFLVNARKNTEMYLIALNDRIPGKHVLRTRHSQRTPLTLAGRQFKAPLSRGLFGKVSMLEKMSH